MLPKTFNVARLACLANRSASINRPVKYASVASCTASIARFWYLNLEVTCSIDCEISLTTRSKGRRLINNSVDLRKRSISRWTIYISIVISYSWAQNFNFKKKDLIEHQFLIWINLTRKIELPSGTPNPGLNLCGLAILIAFIGFLLVLLLVLLLSPVGVIVVNILRGPRPAVCLVRAI